MVTQANKFKHEFEKKFKEGCSDSYKTITVNYKKFFEQLEKYKELSLEELDNNKC